MTKTDFGRYNNVFMFIFLVFNLWFFRDEARVLSYIMLLTFK